MTVRINKPAFNIREKLTELKHKSIELVSVCTGDVTLDSGVEQITGIHETDHPIYFRINGMSIPSGSPAIFMRWGTEDGYYTASNYVYSSTYEANGTGQNNSVASSTGSAQFHIMAGWTADANVHYASFRIQRIGSNNTYYMEGSWTNSTYPEYFTFQTGSLILGKPLTKIQFYTSNGSNFDAGTISVQYLYERNL